MGSPARPRRHGAGSFASGQRQRGGAAGARPGDADWRAAACGGPDGPAPPGPGRGRVCGGHLAVGPEGDQLLLAELRRRDVSAKDTAGGQGPGSNEQPREKRIVVRY